MKARIFSVLLLIGIAASVFALGTAAYTVSLFTPSWIVTDDCSTTQYGVTTWCHSYDTHAEIDDEQSSRANPNIYYEYMNYAEIMCKVPDGNGGWDWDGQKEAVSTSGCSFDPNAAEAWSYEITTDDIYTDEGIAT